ncbi:MAG: bleomycin resistance protein [Deltaproteobacteria bacterium]|nr:bleomycin resistance protein [Deltaproteobacteria bacterium]
MATGIDHTIITVNNYEQASRFYGWLMPKIGYTSGEQEYGTMKGWLGKRMSFWIKKADARFATDTFNKDRIGLCEIAFKGESRTDIDALAKDIVANGGTILDPPKEYDYAPGYYAVFFADPDGIKLEVVHIP